MRDKLMEMLLLLEDYFISEFYLKGGYLKMAMPNKQEFTFIVKEIMS